MRHDPPGGEEELPEAVRFTEPQLDDLAAYIARLTSTAAEHDELLHRLSDEDLPDPGPAQPAAGNGRFIVLMRGNAHEQELESLSQWVEEILLPVYGREISAQAPWCPWWRDHPEAVARLHGLWLAWLQHTAPDAGPSGPAIWHRDFLDHTLLQLRAPNGPFSACTTSAKRPAHRLLPGPASAPDSPTSQTEDSRSAA